MATLLVSEAGGGAYLMPFGWAACPFGELSLALRLCPLYLAPLLFYWVSWGDGVGALLFTGRMGAECVLLDFIFKALSFFWSRLSMGAPTQTGLFVPMTAFLAFTRRKRPESLHFSNNLV